MRSVGRPRETAAMNSKTVGASLPDELAKELVAAGLARGVPAEEFRGIGSGFFSVDNLALAASIVTLMQTPATFDYIAQWLKAHLSHADRERLSFHLTHGNASVEIKAKGKEAVDDMTELLKRIL